MLAALAILAIVSAAMAFKVRHAGVGNLYTLDTNEICNNVGPVDIGPQRPFTATAATVIPDAGPTTITDLCTETITYGFEN